MPIASHDVLLARGFVGIVSIGPVVSAETPRISAINRKLIKI